MPTPILWSLRFKLLRETLAFHVSRVCLYLAFEARQFTVLILGYIAVQPSQSLQLTCLKLIDPSANLDLSVARQWCSINNSLRSVLERVSGQSTGRPRRQASVHRSISLAHCEHRSQVRNAFDSWHRFCLEPRIPTKNVGKSNDRTSQVLEHHIFLTAILQFLICSETIVNRMRYLFLCIGASVVMEEGQ